MRNHLQPGAAWNRELARVLWKPAEHLEGGQVIDELHKLPEGDGAVRAYSESVAYVPFPRRVHCLHSQRRWNPEVLEGVQLWLLEAQGGQIFKGYRVGGV